MATVISIALQKGGTGKSTTALALACILGLKHKKTLLIDMDSQGNATYSSGINNPRHTITDVLGEDCTAGKASIHCKYYDVLAADKWLANVEMAKNVSPALLKNTIQPVTSLYDFIIIDTPPALGNLSINALTASGYVIIPTEARPFALKGLSELNDTIQNVQKRFNTHLKISGILLTRYHNRTILNRDMRDMITDYAQQMGTVVFNNSIREGIAVAEAQAVRKPLADYARKSKPFMDYESFTDELLKMIGE